MTVSVGKWKLLIHELIEVNLSLEDMYSLKLVNISVKNMILRLKPNSVLIKKDMYLCY